MRNTKETWGAGAHAKAGPRLHALGVGMGTVSSCLPSALSSGCCLARSTQSREGKGVQELSVVVSAMTSLNKAHLVGRQRIRQDFCRPDGECFCQGFTISINKHVRAAFGTVSSNFPG